MPEHIYPSVTVLGEGATIGGSTSDKQDTMHNFAEVMHDGFSQLSSSMANAISEAFQSLKKDLEVVYEEESDHENAQAEDHEVQQPPAKKTRGDEEIVPNEAPVNSPVDVEGSLEQLLSKSSEIDTSSNEGKNEVLNCLKQDLQKEQLSPDVDSELATIINSLIKDGLPEDKLQNKMNKYHRPGNCSHLAKVRVNQALWDNLPPTVRSQDLKLQKVQTSLFKGMCALTNTINIILNNMQSIPSGKDLFQVATDSFSFFANANTELNQRRRELIKPELQADYKYLCSSNSTLAVTDQLFGDDLAKEVKELTEVHRVGRQVSNTRGSTPNNFRGRRNFHNFGSRGRGYRGRRPFLGWRGGRESPNQFQNQRNTHQTKPK